MYIAESYNEDVFYVHFHATGRYIHIAKHHKAESMGDYYLLTNMHDDHWCEYFVINDTASNATSQSILESLVTFV